MSSYPNDPFQDRDKYWPEGFGQLTNVCSFNFWFLIAIVSLKQHKNIQIYFFFRLESNNITNWVNICAIDMVHCLEMANMYGIKFMFIQR